MHVDRLYEAPAGHLRPDRAIRRNVTSAEYRDGSLYGNIQLTTAVPGTWYGCWFYWEPTSVNVSVHLTANGDIFQGGHSLHQFRRLTSLNRL
jgi:hypothetical protein